MRLRRRGPWWFVDFERNGRRVRLSLRTADREEAVLKAAREVAHPIGPRPVGGRPLKDLLDAYRAELVRRACSRKHRSDTDRAMRKVTAGATDPYDLSTLAITGRLSEIPGARSRNYARTALHGFFEWLAAIGEWKERNPVAAIACTKVVPKRRRRALTFAELRTLIDATRAQGTLRAQRRAAFYLAAATTGKRKGALRQVVFGYCALEDLAAARIVFPAATQKNGKEKVVPICRELAEALLALRAREEKRKIVRPVPERRVFKGSDARTLASDLEKAGIARVTPEGVVDHHALKVTAGTLLFETGAELDVGQELLDHSDPRLTANIYRRTRMGRLREAVDRVGGALRPEPGKEVPKA